jgi:tetratricopeptide (TPR) repeat protein
MRKLRLTVLAIGLCRLPFAWPEPQPDYSTAVTYVQEGRASQAIPLLERILSVSPGDLKARNLLGIALLNTGGKEEAATQFKKALQIDPAFQPALKNLAVAEIALGRQQEAKLHFTQVLKAVPNDPVAHLYLGEINFAEHQYAEAVTHYLQSGGMYFKDPAVILHAGKSALESNQPQAAEQALEHLPGDAAQLHFDAGVLLSDAKRFDAAARHFQLAQNGYPDPYKVGFNLTLVYVNGGNYSAAIETGERLAQLYRKGELYNLLSRAYEASGKTQEAYDALRTATGLDPQDENNYIDLMSLCVAHENWNLSLEISEIALRYIPAAGRVHLVRGAVFAMQGRLEDASQEFLDASRLDRQSSLPSVALALVRLDMKQPAEAARVLRAWRAQNAKDYRVDWYLAVALNQLGAEPGTATEKEALEALAESVRLNPTVAGPRVLLGKMLVKRDEPDRAAREFEGALKLQPNEVTAAYQLALIYRKAGNTTRAEELMAMVGKAASAPEQGLNNQRELIKIIREGSK